MYGPTDRSVHFNIYIYNRKKERKQVIYIYIYRVQVQPSAFFFALNKSIHQCTLCYPTIHLSLHIFSQEVLRKTSRSWVAMRCMHGFCPIQLSHPFCGFVEPGRVPASCKDAPWVEFRRNHSTTSVTQELFMPSSRTIRAGVKSMAIQNRQSDIE